MWKKKEPEPVTPPAAPRPEPPAPRPAPVQRPERAIIGPTLKIQGEVNGEEDLLVQGRIEGRIEVKGQSVTIGKAGQVVADIHARSIRVEGKVRGDLFGEQEVIIATSGDVEGNLVAPSVRLENGSRFKGSIDMERAQQRAPQPMIPGGKASQEPGQRPQNPTAPTPRQPSQQT